MSESIRPTAMGKTMAQSLIALQRAMFAFLAAWNFEDTSTVDLIATARELNIRNADFNLLLDDLGMPRA